MSKQAPGAQGCAPEMIVRACGHTVEFHGKGDHWDNKRRENLRTRRCRECGEQKMRADNAANATGLPPKGQELRHIPPTVLFTLCCGESGWSGVAEGEGVKVGASATSALALMPKLARQWLKARAGK